MPGVKVEPEAGGQRVLANGALEDQEQHKEVESMHKLVAVIQRHGLHNKKKPVDNVILPNKSSLSFHELSVALSETDNEVKEPMGQRSMANSLVGGNINSFKTRSLLFVKTEPKPDQAFQGGMNFPLAYHCSRKRLVLCGGAKNSLVEAIIQVGDDQEEEAVPPHHVLPTMSNVHVADRFAKQYCAPHSLKKEKKEEGYAVPVRMRDSLETNAKCPATASPMKRSVFADMEAFKLKFVKLFDLKVYEGGKQ